MTKWPADNLPSVAALRALTYTARVRAAKIRECGAGIRAALLTVAVLTLAAPAQAQERLCQPPAVPPRAPTAAEKERART